MGLSLAEELRRIRAVRGVSLREVEENTKVSNAYLSQLETGKTSSPSPEILYRLASYYEVPYASLMEAAGYLRKEPAAKKQPSLGALQAALMSAQLTEEEQHKVAEFIGYLRSQRQRKGR